MPSHLAPVPGHYRKVVRALKKHCNFFYWNYFPNKEIHTKDLADHFTEVQKEEKHFLWKNISDIFIDCLIFNIMRIKRVEFSIFICNQKYWELYWLSKQQCWYIFFPTPSSKVEHTSVIFATVCNWCDVRLCSELIRSQGSSPECCHAENGCAFRWATVSLFIGWSISMSDRFDVHDMKLLNLINLNADVLFGF